ERFIRQQEFAVFEDFWAGVIAEKDRSVGIGPQGPDLLVAEPFCHGSRDRVSFELAVMHAGQSVTANPDVASGILGNRLDRVRGGPARQTDAADHLNWRMRQPLIQRPHPETSLGVFQDPERPGSGYR